MMRTFKRLSLVACSILLFVALTGCSKFGGRNAGFLSKLNEYNITVRHPLSLPPSFNTLPPVRPGTPQRGITSSADKARRILVGEKVQSPVRDRLRRTQQAALKRAQTPSIEDGSSVVPGVVVADPANDSSIAPGVVVADEADSGSVAPGVVVSDDQGTNASDRPAITDPK